MREEGKQTLIDNTMIKVTITTEQGEYQLQVNPKNGEYRTVYKENEDVLQYEDNFICTSKIGNLVQDGIEWAIAMDEEGTSWAVKDQYEYDFTEDLAIYYNDEIMKRMNDYMTSTPTYREEENILE